MSYPNQRDCEHGSKLGKCVICDYQQDIKELKDKLEALIINAEKQLEIEAKRYVSLSNKWIAGELTDIPEGSILSESIYVENRIKDIKDPLFIDLKSLLESFKLEQQAKGIEHLIQNDTTIARLHNSQKRSFIFCQDANKYANQLRAQAEKLKEKGE